MADSQIIELIAQAESNYGLPTGLLDRLVSLESGYNPKAYNSASGASGLTQIIKRFHPTVSDPFNPYEALDYTARRLRGWFDEFGDWQSSVAAWHAGETAVRQARAQGKAIPGTVDRITGLSTASYVSRIVGGIDPGSSSSSSGFELQSSDFFNLSIFGFSPVVSVFVILGLAAITVSLIGGADD